MEYYIVNGELHHHGIKGMKWGIRRTAEQLGHVVGRRKKARAEKKAEAEKKVESKPAATKTSTESEQPKKKSVSDMSDEELQRALNRIRLEKQYAELTAQPKQVSKGKKFADKVLNEVLVPAATDVGKQLVKSYMTKGVNQVLKLEGDYKVHANNKKK